MLIAFLDIATRTGWAWGSATATCKPVYGAIRIKEAEESNLMAPVKISYFLRDMFEGRIDKLAEYPSTIPDILAYEAPLTPEAWFQMCKRKGKPQNGASLTMQHTCAGAVEAICGEFGVRTVTIQRQSVVAHFTGRRSWKDSKDDEDGRKKGKQAVIAQCKLLGLVPLRFNDDDVCDAIAGFDYTRAYWGRVAPQTLQLFGQGT